MSEFTVPVVKIGKVGKHPNADSLSITQVHGCPVIFRTGDYVEGDLAVYVPVDSVVPVKNPLFSFLTDNELKETLRIKAKKIRGIFSMGLLIKWNPGSDNTDGQIDLDVADSLGIVKYEEIVPANMNTDNESDPHLALVYEVEHYRKYKHVLLPGEEVVVTTKLHGCNGRFLFKDGRLWVGSHRTFKKENPNNLWWKIAAEYDLANILAKIGSDYVLYGEVVGTQDLTYGLKKGQYRFHAFDIYDHSKRRFLSYDQFSNVCDAYMIPTVPVLYRGPYIEKLIEPMASGIDFNQIREGIVIKPIKDRWDHACGRVILKLISEEYYLRKSGTEFH